MRTAGSSTDVNHQSVGNSTLTLGEKCSTCTASTKETNTEGPPTRDICEMVVALAMRLNRIRTCTLFSSGSFPRSSPQNAPSTVCSNMVQCVRLRGTLAAANFFAAVVGKRERRGSSQGYSICNDVVVWDCRRPLLIAVPTPSINSNAILYMCAPPAQAPT